MQGPSREEAGKPSLRCYRTRGRKPRRKLQAAQTRLAEDTDSEENKQGKKKIIIHSSSEWIRQNNISQVVRYYTLTKVTSNLMV